MSSMARSIGSRAAACLDCTWCSRGCSTSAAPSRASAGSSSWAHPRPTPPKGLIIGKREPALGLRGIPETELIFDNLEVPADMLLKPQRGQRHGFGELMDAYNGQRVGAATVALGLAQGAYEKALTYANKR